MICSKVEPRPDVPQRGIAERPWAPPQKYRRGQIAPLFAVERFAAEVFLGSPRGSQFPSHFRWRLCRSIVVLGIDCGTAHGRAHHLKSRKITVPLRTTRGNEWSFATQ